MEINRIFLTLLALIIIVSFFGVQGDSQGQYATPSSGNASQDPSQYTEFYAITAGPASGDPLGALQQFETSGIMPTTLYLGEQMQPVTYSQYWSSPAYTKANSLWVKGITSWIQYAVVPQGATVTLVAFSPTGGIGTLTVVDSSGQTSGKNYIFYPNSIFTFYTYTIGRHILSFAINGQSSNQVVIYVVGTQPSTNNYPIYYPLDYYPGYYPGDYYPGYYPGDYYPGYYPHHNRPPGGDHNVPPGGDHNVPPGGDHNVPPGGDHNVPPRGYGS